MKKSDWKLEKMKWILDSIDYINSKKPTNYDALLLGGFSGSVIEFLGKCLRAHVGAYKGINLLQSKDFLDKYMKKYSPYVNILYRNLRCEGAHNVLAQIGVRLSCDKRYQKRHLKGCYEKKRKQKYLHIYSPEFLEDLKTAVESFLCEVKTNPSLEKKCRETLMEVFEYGQNIINTEEKVGKFKIDYIIS